MLPVDVLYATQNWGWCWYIAGVSLIQTLWNPMTNLETSIFMIHHYICVSLIVSISEIPSCLCLSNFGNKYVIKSSLPAWFHFMWWLSLHQTTPCTVGGGITRSRLPRSSHLRVRSSQVKNSNLQSSGLVGLVAKLSVFKIGQFWNLLSSH